MDVRLFRLLALAALTVIAGCATPPAIFTPEPEPGAPPPYTEEARRQSVGRHLKTAQDAMRTGDFAVAATHWQILVLLAPSETSYSDALAAANAGIVKGVRDNMAVATTALAANDHERAAQAALRALALDPDNADAARMLRDIDRRRMARVQSDRANRARIEDAMAIRNTVQNQAAGDGATSFEIDQALELFRAGDSAAGLRELRAYVEVHPTNRSGRQRAGQAVADRARELEDKGSRAEALELYDQATALYGDKAPWATRATNLRRALVTTGSKTKP